MATKKQEALDADLTDAIYAWEGTDADLATVEEIGKKHYGSGFTPAQHRKILRKIFVWFRNQAASTKGDDDPGVPAAYREYARQVGDRMKLGKNPEAMGSDDFVRAVREKANLGKGHLVTKTMSRLGGERYDTVTLLFVNVPEERGSRGALGANNRVLMFVRGFGRGQNEPPPSGKVQFEIGAAELLSGTGVKRPRGKTSSPERMVDYVAKVITEAAQLPMYEMNPPMKNPIATAIEVRDAIQLWLRQNDFAYGISFVTPSHWRKLGHESDASSNDVGFKILGEGSDFLHYLEGPEFGYDGPFSKMLERMGWRWESYSSWAISVFPEFGEVRLDVHEGDSYDYDTREWIPFQEDHPFRFTRTGTKPTGKLEAGGGKKKSAKKKSKKKSTKKRNPGTMSNPKAKTFTTGTVVRTTAKFLRSIGSVTRRAVNGIVLGSSGERVLVAWSDGSTGQIQSVNLQKTKKQMDPASAKATVTAERKEAIRKMDTELWSEAEIVQIVESYPRDDVTATYSDSARMHWYALPPERRRGSLDGGDAESLVTLEDRSEEWRSLARNPAEIILYDRMDGPFERHPLDHTDRSKAIAEAKRRLGGWKDKGDRWAEYTDDRGIYHVLITTMGEDTDIAAAITGLGPPQKKVGTGSAGNPGARAITPYGKFRGVPLPAAISVAWSPVNQAYFVMWHDTVLRVISDDEEVKEYLRELGEGASAQPNPERRWQVHGKTTYSGGRIASLPDPDTGEPHLRRGTFVIDAYGDEPVLYFTTYVPAAAGRTGQLVSGMRLFIQDLGKGSVGDLKKLATGLTIQENPAVPIGEGRFLYMTHRQLQDYLVRQGREDQKVKKRAEKAAKKAAKKEAKEGGGSAKRRGIFSSFLRV